VILRPAAYQRMGVMASYILAGHSTWHTLRPLVSDCSTALVITNRAGSATPLVITCTRI
jgi:hypothetical protein